MCTCVCAREASSFKRKWNIKKEVHDPRDSSGVYVCPQLFVCLCVCDMTELLGTLSKSVFLLVIKQDASVQLTTSWANRKQ